MAAIHGREFGAKLVEALGLKGRMVRDIVISAKLDEVVTIRFSFLVRPDGPRAEVDVLEFASGEQVAAVHSAIVRDTTNLDGESGVTADGYRWREYSSGEFEEREGVLALEGPAERLALAVLKGDAPSALVLADMVQELWAERVAARG